jgi:hypothetical protein
VKKLYNGLRGPIADINLKPFLAAGAVSAAALLATGCPAPGGGTGTTPFAAPVTNPFGLTSNPDLLVRPCLVDIDNDGDLDVFTGTMTGGIYYYKNTGTASAPVFAAATANPFGLTHALVGGYVAPCFVDIDNDGTLDAFIGNLSGDTLYFQNTGTASAPVFTAAATNPFNLANVGKFAAPAFADIDNDGTLDAFIGNSDGDTVYFHNTGTASVPNFAAPVTNPFGLTNVGTAAAPCFADIDNDGDLDAIIGNGDGNTLYFQNTGTASAPVFAAPVTNPFGLTNVGTAAAPCFADIDNDGDLDGLFGNYSGNFLFFRNTTH